MSSSNGVPWHTSTSRLTVRGPAGRAATRSRFFGVSVLCVQRAASAATRRERSGSTTPVATLSWLPRMTTAGSSSKIRSTTSFGFAP